MTARQPLTPPAYDATALANRIARHWDSEIVGELVEYVRLPAKSPHFDPRWREHGHIEAAIQQARASGPASENHQRGPGLGDRDAICTSFVPSGKSRDSATAAATTGHQRRSGQSQCAAPPGAGIHPSLFL